jgi:hypothetical protein
MVLMSIALSALSVLMRASRIAIVAVATFVTVSPVKAEYAKLSDDLTLHYEQAGKGPQTILFIPGWMMSTKVFERQFKHFEASTRFRAIAYDPRGQGSRARHSTATRISSMGAIWQHSSRSSA